MTAKRSKLALVQVQALALVQVQVQAQVQAHVQAQVQPQVQAPAQVQRGSDMLALLSNRGLFDLISIGATSATLTALKDSLPIDDSVANVIHKAATNTARSPPCGVCNGDPLAKGYPQCLTCFAPHSVRCVCNPRPWNEGSLCFVCGADQCLSRCRSCNGTGRSENSRWKLCTCIDGENCRFTCSGLRIIFLDPCADCNAGGVPFPHGARARIEFEGVLARAIRDIKDFGNKIYSLAYRLPPGHPIKIFEFALRTNIANYLASKTEDVLSDLVVAEMPKAISFIPIDEVRALWEFKAAITVSLAWCNETSRVGRLGRVLRNRQLIEALPPAQQQNVHRLAEIVAAAQQLCANVDDRLGAFARAEDLAISALSPVWASFDALRADLAKIADPLAVQFLRIVATLPMLKEIKQLPRVVADSAVPICARMLVDIAGWKCARAMRNAPFDRGTGALSAFAQSVSALPLADLAAKLVFRADRKVIEVFQALAALAPR